MHEANYLPLLTISVLAFIVPILTARLARLRKIRIPTMIGEIAAGIIVGKSGLNLISSDPWVNFLSTFGFGYLMFLSGLELDFDVLLGRKKPETGEPLNRWTNRPLVLAALFFISSLGLGYWLAQPLVAQGHLTEPWLITLIMSTVSLGIVVPVLKEQNYEKTAFGQNMIVVSSLADFGSIILVAVLASIYSGGSSFQLLLGLLLIVALVILYRIGQHLLLQKEFTSGIPRTTSQMGVRFSFAVILIFMSMAQSVGIEAILGSFLAGNLISMLFRHNKQELQDKLEAIGYGFFIPAFFIMVGVDFDLWALLGSWQALQLVPLLLLFSFVVKFIPALWYRLAFNWRKTLAAGSLLSAQLSFTIAAAAIGLRIGLISNAVNAALILNALLTAILSPLLFNRILPKVEEPEPKILLIGSPRRIQTLGKELELGKMPVLTWEVTDQVPTLEELGQVQLDTSTRVVIATESEEINYQLAELISGLAPAEVLVIGQDSAQTKSLEELGVRSLTPTSALIMVVTRLIHQPALFNLLYDDSHSTVREVHLTPGSPAIGKAVKELQLPTATLILTIVRQGNQHIVPGGSTVLQTGDTLFIMDQSPETAAAVDRCLLGR